mgnify:CR=1 FL=1
MTKTLGDITSELTAKVLSPAKAEAEQILREARGEAEKIVTAARDEASKMREAAGQEAECGRALRPGGRLVIHTQPNRTLALAHWPAVSGAP